MSISVELSELPVHISRVGSRAFLITNSTDGPPHVASVSVSCENNKLTMGAGRKSCANAATNPAVTLVWPEVDDKHCLIVDGEVLDDAAEPFTVQPTSAILHRLHKT